MISDREWDEMRNAAQFRLATLRDEIRETRKGNRADAIEGVADAASTATSETTETSEQDERQARADAISEVLAGSPESNA